MLNINQVYRGTCLLLSTQLAETRHKYAFPVLAICIWFSGLDLFCDNRKTGEVMYSIEILLLNRFITDIIHVYYF